MKKIIMFSIFAIMTCIFSSCSEEPVLPADANGNAELIPL